MGTSGLVGQISTFTAMPQVPFTKLLGIVILMHIILPAILTFSIYEIFYRKGLIQDGDMKPICGPLQYRLPCHCLGLMPVKLVLR